LVPSISAEGLTKKLFKDVEYAMKVYETLEQSVSVTTVVESNLDSSAVYPLEDYSEKDVNFLLKPVSITLDLEKNAYIIDNGYNAILKLDEEEKVSLYSDKPPSGLRKNYLFNDYSDIIFDPKENRLIFSDTGRCVIRSISLASKKGDVLAGDLSFGCGVPVDTTAGPAIMSRPSKLCLDDESEYLYFIDSDIIRSLKTSSNKVELLAGRLGNGKIIDEKKELASFEEPTGIAFLITIFMFLNLNLMLFVVSIVRVKSKLL